MHPCLETREIVTQICDEAWNDKCRSGKSAVLSLALTARSINDIATDIIWYGIPNIEPLLRCSPKLLMQNQNAHSIDIIRLDNLQRMIDLAKRVRRLGPRFQDMDATERHLGWLNVNLHQRIDATIYQFLHILTAGQPPLPHVQDVNLCHLTVGILPFVYMLTNPNINRLKLACDFNQLSPKDVSLIFGFLHNIHNQFPFLEDLDLHVVFDPKIPHLPEHIADIIRSNKFNRLTRLCMGPEVSSKIISHLLEYRVNLSSLCIRVPLDHSPLPAIEANIGFSDIKTIMLYTTKLDLATELLQRVRGVAPVKTLLVVNHTHPLTSSTQIWKHLIEIIHMKCSHEGMMKLTLRDYPEEPPSEDYSPHFSLKADYLGNLSAFKSLQKVTVTTCGTTKLENSTLRKLASSWPQIRELELLGWAQISPPPEITLDGLAAFAEYCPYLKELGIEFYAHTERTSLSHGRPRYQIHLNELLVYDSVITKSILVAALLADIFPTIKKLECAQPALTGNEVAPHLWDQVREYHKVISNVRADAIQRFTSNTT